MNEPLSGLTERYLGLESFDGIEEIVATCGATIDERALPILWRRLHEEENALPLYRERGYVRIAEKAEQMIGCLRSLIVGLEGHAYDSQE